MKKDKTQRLKGLADFIIKRTDLDIRSSCRKFDYVMARVVYSKIARDVIGGIFQDIGDEINRNHATIIHSLKLFNEVERDIFYRKLYEDSVEFIECYEDVAKFEDGKMSYKEMVLVEKIIKLKAKFNAERLIHKNNIEEVKRIQLEPHEIKYRELSEDKQDIYRFRANAMLTMI
jgi:hypothetical protein